MHPDPRSPHRLSSVFSLRSYPRWFDLPACGGLRDDHVILCTLLCLLLLPDILVYTCAFIPTDALSSSMLWNSHAAEVCFLLVSPARVCVLFVFVRLPLCCAFTAGPVCEASRHGVSRCCHVDMPAIMPAARAAGRWRLHRDDHQTSCFSMCPSLQVRAGLAFPWPVRGCH